MSLRPALATTAAPSSGKSRAIRFWKQFVVRLALKFYCLLVVSISLHAASASAQQSLADAQEESSGEVAVPAESTLESSTSNSIDASTGGAATSPLSTNPWQAQNDFTRDAPDVYLLPDEFGKLRKVLGFRYEDFFEAWKSREPRAVITPPRYALDAVAISGKVLQTHAQLRIEFAITLQTSSWTDVPVQLPDFIVQQFSIDEQAEGECLVFDSGRHGHVVWLSGAEGKKRKVVFEGLTKLKLAAGTHGIELHLPRATASQFRLRLPDTNSRFESSPELALTTTKSKDGTTEVHLLGQANPLRLNWTPENQEASKQAALIEVEGETVVHLDRRRASYETHLKINSFDRPFEVLQVYLPDGAKLNLGEPSSEYALKILDSSASPNGRQVVEVRLPEPQQTPVDIRLAAEIPLVYFNDSAECIIEGFEVLSAIRQSGTLTVEVDDQLQAYFDTYGDIDQAPAKDSNTTLENRSILANFRYTRFPWRLAVFTSPRQKRVSVKPHFRLSIGAEEAMLNVEYDYQLTGAQIFSLRVDLRGWALTDAPIESGGLINSDGVVETRDGHLVLPLVDPDTQQLQLNLSLRKEIELGDNSFLLPEPLGGAFVVDGELIVNASAALRVAPKHDEMTGLSIIAPVDNFSSDTISQYGGGQEGPINLRTFLAQPKFVAAVTQRPRQVFSLARTQVEIQQERIGITQRLDYQSRYQPVSQLSLNLPEALVFNDSLKVTLDGEQLTFAVDGLLEEEALERSIDASPANDVAERQMIVSLPRPIQNDIPIEISFEISAPELTTDELASVLLPLITPQDDVRGHEVVVSAAEPILVTANQRSVSDQWQVVTENRPAGNTEGEQADQKGAALYLTTDKNLTYVSLYAQLDSSDKVQLATLDRAWIQSWITHGQRQERAVFRFRTPYSMVFAQLPADLLDVEIEVLLDGQPWDFQRSADNRLAIPLNSIGSRSTADQAANGQLDSHSLELRYQTPTELPSWGELRNSLPHLECRTASAPIYWQLILPRGWQLATSPQQLVADYWLGWKNYRWGRQPTLSQADLEQVTGAVPAIGPTPMSSQYVYRAFEIPAEIQVVVIRQSWLFVSCVIAAFGIGLLWLYTSIAESGVFWLSLSLTLLAGIYSYPEIAVLAIQVILVGGLLTFVTAVLRRTFIDDVRLRPATSNYPHEPFTEITETWHQRQRERRDDSEPTATLQTSEPLP